MLRFLGKVAEFLFRMLSYPLLFANWLFGAISGENRWIGEQQQRMTEGRAPLDDADFVSRLPMHGEQIRICLAVRDAFAFHCGLPKTAIYPDDGVAVLFRLMSPWAGFLDIIFRVEHALGITVSVRDFQKRWREAELRVGEVSFEEFASIVASASQGTAPTSQGISVRVIGLMSPGSVRVVVGQGVGLLDGGNEQTWPIEWVPASARRPNGEFRISGFKAGMPQVVVGPDEV